MKVYSYQQKDYSIVFFYCAIIIAYIIIWWWEGIETSSLSGRTAIARLLKLSGDAALLTAPFIFLPRRFQRITIIPVAIVSIWAVCAVWYFRFWKDTPGLSSILLFGNFNGELFHSLVSLWNPTDWLILLIPILLLVFYNKIIRRSASNYEIKTGIKYAILFGAVVWFTTGQLIASHNYRGWAKDVGQSLSLMTATKERILHPIATNTGDLSMNGPLVHFVKSLVATIKLASLTTKLTDADCQLIEEFINKTPAFAELPDSLINANRNKNVILILVESLNAYVINDSIGGEPIAPVLNKLLRASGSLSALNITTQVKTGGSGDGQLIANTGLYPLSTFSAAIALGSRNEFPSLVRALDRKDNVVIFGDDASAWNEYDTFCHYGFSRLVTHREFQKLYEETGGDAALMRYSTSLLKTLNQPFFMELLTVSMHVPFNDEHIPASMLKKWKDKYRSSTELDYLSMVHYFDSELGRFIKNLEIVGLSENTILIIVSDHSQELTAEGDGIGQSDVPMAMIIANCGVTDVITKPVGQIDVYPTILNVCGAVGPKEWRGVGKSMLSSEGENVKRNEEAEKISEIILRTDYFKQ